MTSSKRFAALLAVLVFGSCFASADILTVGGPVTGTTLTIKDNALTALNSGWANGVTAYIDPYHGTLGTQAVILFCIDPNHLDSSAPYQVTISPNGSGNGTLQELNVTGGSGVLPGSGSLSTYATAAGFTTAAQLYGGLAWLSQQLQQSSDPLTQQEYQAAIWQLGDYTNSFTVVNAPSGFGSTLGACGLAKIVCSLEQQAETNALTSGFEILTDSNEVKNGVNAGQEYLVLTPEPSSILLSMSGLLGFFTFRRRKTA